MDNSISESGGLIRVPRADLKKASTQKDKNAKDYGKYIDPEYDPDSLIAIYEKNSTANKCISLIATKTVSNGWNITSSEDKDPDEESAYEFFNHCNPEESFEDVIIAMVTDRQTVGSASLEICRNQATQMPEYIYHMPISNVRVGKGEKNDFKTGQRFAELDSNGLIANWYNRYYADPTNRTKKNGYDRKINGTGKATNDVMWFKLPNPKSRWYGTAPSISLLKLYLIAIYAEDFNVNEFENGMLNKLAITVKNGKLTRDSIEGLKAYMQELIASKQWSSIPVLQATGQNAEVKIERLSPDIKESSFLETMKFIRENIYVAFGVPPIMLGLVENATLANQAAQEKKFYETEIKPLQNQIARRFTRMLQEDFGYKNLTFAFNEPNFEDEQKRAELDLKNQQAGVLSINEIRSKAGLDPVGGGDRPFIMTSFGVIFIDEIENMSTEEAVEKMHSRVSEKLIDGLLNYKKSLEGKVQEKLIKDGQDGGEETKYNEKE